MAIKYYGGNKITGLGAPGSADTKPTLTTDMKGATFFETDTDDVYNWDGDSWNIVAGNTLIQDLSNKTFTDFCKVSEVATPSGTVGAGKGVIYAKTVSSVGKAYWKFENEDEIELTAGAGVGTTLSGHSDTTISGLPTSGTTGHILVYDNSNSWDNKLLAGIASGGAGECVISITTAGLVGIDSIQGLATGTSLDVVSAGNAAIFPSIGAYTLSVGHVDSTVNILGNLTVSGVTTTVDTTNLLVEDPLIIISKAQTGTASVDSGFVVERGNDQNVGLIWDESTNTFVFINTDEVGTTAGNVTIASYAPMKAASIEGTVGLLTTSLETRGKLLIDSANANLTSIVADGHLLHMDAVTLTDNTTSASGTASANFALFTIDQPTLAATNASTTTIASTMYIAGAPAAGTNETLTNAYALYVAAGTVKFGGDVEQGDTTLASLIVTGATVLNGTMDFGNAVTDTITVTGRFDSNLIPITDSAYDLGTAALQWRVAYIDTIGETGDGAILIEPRIGNGGYIADAAGNQQIIFTTTGSAVNEFTVANAAANGSPTLSVTGGDTDVALTLKSKGADGIIVAGSTDNGAFLEFQQIASPGSPSLEYARLYLKRVDAQNNAIAVKLQKANTIQEVEITSPKAICGECGSTDGAKDPTYDFSRSTMLVELWCGHAYEVPMTGWNMVS